MTTHTASNWFRWGGGSGGGSGGSLDHTGKMTAKGEDRGRGLLSVFTGHGGKYAKDIDDSSDEEEIICMLINALLPLNSTS